MAAHPQIHWSMCLAVALATSACRDPDPASDATETSTESDSTDATDDAPTTDTGTTADVTYHGDIRALMEQHCVRCHTPGNIAPFPLTSYQEVHSLREPIVLSMESRTMPPWMADGDCTDYLADPTVPQADIDLVRAWLDQGAAEGSPDDYVAPPAPELPGLSRVDLTLTMEEPYVPQGSPDDYRCFVLDWPQTELSYVTGFRALPGDERIVHHVIAYRIDPDYGDTFVALDEADPGPGYTCYGGPGAQPNDIGSADIWMGAWAPGGYEGDFLSGNGIPVEPGSKVILQVHYNTTTAEPVPDQTSMEFKIDAQVERPAFLMLWTNPDWLSGAMQIPAGAPSTVHAFEADPTQFMDALTDLVPSNEPFRVYSTSHHMHTLGTRARQAIVHPDGSETCLLDIPRWDFDWQQSYPFAEPITFQPGDRLRVECEWDNSAGTQDVGWGDGTQDEMCLGIFFVTAQ